VADPNPMLQGPPPPTRAIPGPLRTQVAERRPKTMDVTRSASIRFSTVAMAVGDKSLAREIGKTYLQPCPLSGSTFNAAVDRHSVRPPELGTFRREGPDFADQIGSPPTWRRAPRRAAGREDGEFQRTSGAPWLLAQVPP